MATVMKAAEFVKRLKTIATDYKSLYIMGCFGAPMNPVNKKRYSNNHTYNRNPVRSKMIFDADEDTFGFDCVGLVYAVLWGWNGRADKVYGGAGFRANGVPYYAADYMFQSCRNKSSNFNKIEIGELLWMPGHVGVYIGDGLSVECTPKWKNKVQITACVKPKSGYDTRAWEKHGFYPYVDYSSIPIIESQSDKSTEKTPVSNEQVIWSFLLKAIKNSFGVAGLMGNLYAESALKPNNVANRFEKASGYTDESYTRAVDNGQHDNFARDGAAYGLAQWTHWSRKEELYRFAKNKALSIGDLNMQLEFIMYELRRSFRTVLKGLENATSVREASNLVLTKYERPANQSDAEKMRRAEFGEKYYSLYI